MPKYRLDISYDGTHYVGWQKQPNGVSIQGTIEQALAKWQGKAIPVIGAGRTDSGVHALGQVAHFSLDDPLEERIILKALNGMLPHDIRVKECLFAPDNFHACFSSREKHYNYYLWLNETIEPFYRLYWHHHRAAFSLDKLKEAAAYFVGTHDFASFAAAGGSAKTTVRTIYSIDIREEKGGICLEFRGNGFLYKMVRTIVGTLLAVASGKNEPTDIPLMFAAKDRRAASMTAPACGLFLMKVNY